MIKLSSIKRLPKWHSVVSRYVNIEKMINNREKIVFGFRLALLWAAAGVGIIGFLFGFDLVGGALESLMTLIFEFIQEKLETMYRQSFKLDIYHAQMATAYTGFIVLVGLIYLLFKKFSVVCREMREIWNHELVKAGGLWLKHWDNIKSWWGTLDTFNKYSAVIALTVVAIPFFSLICFALGKVVAEIV